MQIDLIHKQHAVQSKGECARALAQINKLSFCWRASKYTDANNNGGFCALKGQAKIKLLEARKGQDPSVSFVLLHKSFFVAIKISDNIY